MNDKAEGKEFFEIYENIAKELLYTNQINQEFYDLIFEYEHKDVFWSGDYFSLYPYEECETYICSFSEGKDILALWNYYSKNDQYEGYNLGIRFDEEKNLSNAFLSIGRGAEIDLYKVIYDKNKVENSIRELIIKLFSKYICVNTITKQSLINDIRMLKTILRYIVKNKAFMHEQEYRFILRIPKKGNSPVIDFKTKKGVLVPYINLSLNKYLIKEITIGPLIEQDIAKRTLEFFLQQNGYKIRNDNNIDEGIIISSSEVPIRY